MHAVEFPPPILAGITPKLVEIVLNWTISANLDDIRPKLVAEIKLRA
jgi:hypothetical protein